MEFRELNKQINCATFMQQVNSTAKIQLQVCATPWPIETTRPLSRGLGHTTSAELYSVLKVTLKGTSRGKMLDERASNSSTLKEDSKTTKKNYFKDP